MQGATVIYDGDCPFCSAYVSMVRLRSAVGKVELINARDGGPAVRDVLARGYDLDEGMVLIYAGNYYHGADCMNRIALLTSPVGPFNAFSAFVFRSSTISSILYPVLRGGRNLVLRLLGRRKLADG